MTFDLSKLTIRPIHSFNFTYNFMRSFIDHAETNISNSIKHFKDVGPEVDEIEICAEENIYQFVEYYMGLDNADVDLEETFTKHFPSLQRRSALLTLFGTYEHEIEKFCMNYAKQEESPVSLSDIKGKGLERCHLFIKKIIGLTESPSFLELKKVIPLRNSCAHNDGRYKRKDNQEIREIVELIAEQPNFLEKNYNEVLLKEGFLRYVIDLFDAYIKEIEAVIKSKGK